VGRGVGGLGRDRGADAIAYSAAISACEKGGGRRKALALLGGMRRNRIEPDTRAAVVGAEAVLVAVLVAVFVAAAVLVGDLLG